MHAIWLRRAIAYDVESNLSTRGLDRLIDLARRHRKAFGHDLKVIDERLHLRLHLLAVGQNNLRCVRANRTFRHSFQRLLANLLRFSQLSHTYLVSSPDVSVLMGRNLELEVLIPAVRHIASQVKVDAARSKNWTASAQFDYILGRNLRHTLGTSLPDRITCQQAFVLVNLFREAIDELLRTREPIQRRFHRKSADAEVRSKHALPTDCLENLQQLFALAEAIEEYCHRADIHGVRSQPHQVRIDAGQLCQQDAHPYSALRNVQPEQLFHRQAEPELVRKRRQVVHAISERNALLVELGLVCLLDPGMQEADVRHDLHDRLAVNLQQQPKHSVRGRMLRSHVEDHRAVFACFQRCDVLHQI